MLLQFVIIISKINNNIAVYMIYGYILIIINNNKITKERIKKIYLFTILNIII